MGFVESGTYQTYMDDSGNFYLGGTSGALTWNGTNLNLDGGSITFTNQNSIDLGDFNNDSGFTNDDELDSLIAGTKTGGTFINAKTIASPIIAGVDGFFQNTFKVGDEGITCLLYTSPSPRDS